MIVLVSKTTRANHFVSRAHFTAAATSSSAIPSAQADRELGPLDWLQRPETQWNGHPY